MIKMTEAVNQDKINNFLGVWLLIGFVWLALGVAYIPVNKIYQQGVVVLFYLPAITLIWRNFNQFIRLFNAEPILFGFLFSLLFYVMANSAIRGDYKLVKHPLYVGVFVIAGAWVAMNGWLERHGRKAWLIIILGVSLLCAASIGVFLADPSTTLLNRMIGLLEINHVILGSYYVAFFLLASAIVAVERRCYSLLSLTILLALFILFAQSRGAYGALVIAFAAYFLLFIKKNRLTVFVATVFSLIVATLAVIYFEAIIRSGLSYRPEIIESSFKMALEKPWFGHGLDADYWVYTTNHPEGFWHAHNLPAHLAIELGILGLVLFGSLWCYALWFCYRNRNLLLARLAFVWLVFSSVAFQTDAASFIAQPRLEWMVCWLPLCLTAAVAAKKQTSEKSDVCAGVREAG